MTVIDERGRIFGLVNAVDVAALAIVAAAGGFAFAGYRVFRLPPAPVVNLIEPASQPEGKGLQLRVRGANFLPFVRAFVQRAGAAPALAHDPRVHKPADDYTLVNTTLAPWVVESPSVAQVQLPDDLAPGTYDLLFFNETREVGRKAAAFTVTPRPAAPPPSATPIPADADASVAVRFVCRPDVAALIKAGDRDRAGAKIVSIGARKQSMSHTTVNEGGRRVTVEEPVVTLDAVIGARAARIDGAWIYNGAALKAGGDLTFETPSYTVRAWILTVTPTRASTSGSGSND